MIVAPIARSVEAAGPDAQTCLPGGGLLCPVGPRGYGQAFSHHGCAEVAPLNRAGGEDAAILIGAVGPAIDRAGRKQRGHTIARGPAAGPWGAVGRVALLGQFGSIKAEQADAGFPETEAVAVACPSLPRDWRQGLIESGGEQCCSGQNHDGEQGAGLSPEKRIATEMSSQDFTTR